MPPEAEHQKIKALLEENNKVIKENNELLQKMYKQALWGLVAKVVWIAILIGVPFILYYYLLEPVVNLYTGEGGNAFIEEMEALLE